MIPVKPPNLKNPQELPCISIFSSRMDRGSVPGGCSVMGSGVITVVGAVFFSGTSCRDGRGVVVITGLSLLPVTASSRSRTSSFDGVVRVGGARLVAVTTVSGDKEARVMGVVKKSVVIGDPVVAEGLPSPPALPTDVITTPPHRDAVAMVTVVVATSEKAGASSWGTVWLEKGLPSRPSKKRCSPWKSLVSRAWCRRMPRRRGLWLGGPAGGVPGPGDDEGESVSSPVTRPFGPAASGEEPEEDMEHIDR